MNTNTMELNLNELATVNGGTGGTKDPNPKVAKSVKNWICNTVAPATVNFGKAVGTLGKAACNWFTGLFS